RRRFLVLALLFRRRFRLVLVAPFLVRHSVNDAARAIVGKIDAPLLRGRRVPLREPVAAEAGGVHEIDVLDVGAAPQVFHQTAESGGFDLGTGFVIHCDCSEKTMAIVWADAARVSRNGTFSARSGGLQERLVCGSQPTERTSCSM